MTNQTSIQYISSLLENPGTISDGDQGSISLFRQTYPYFVPMHYFIALESHKKTSYTPEMLSAMQPYMGNWILFCDFLDEGSSPTGKLKTKQTIYADVTQQQDVINVAEPAHANAIAEQQKDEPIRV